MLFRSVSCTNWTYCYSRVALIHENLSPSSCVDDDGILLTDGPTHALTNVEAIPDRMSEALPSQETADTMTMLTTIITKSAFACWASINKARSPVCNGRVRLRKPSTLNSRHYRDRVSSRGCDWFKRLAMRSQLQALARVSHPTPHSGKPRLGHDQPNGPKPARGKSKTRTGSKLSSCSAPGWLDGPHAP